jgi:hypothetical protein
MCQISLHFEGLSEAHRKNKLGTPVVVLFTIGKNFGNPKLHPK